MTVLPWRVRNFVSEHFPVLYHVAANFGVTGNSIEHWNRRLAETWDDPGRNWPTKNELVASLTDASQAIVDVGCGNGSMLRYLSERGYSNLHGVEISDYAIRRLRDYGIDMHFGNLPAIPLPDAAFDIVIASQVLEHIIRRRTFLREIRRILKPKGRALIFVPDDCLGPISEPEHAYKYNAESLRRLLGRYFSIIGIESISDRNFEIPILFAHVMYEARTERAATGLAHRTNGMNT